MSAEGPVCATPYPSPNWCSAEASRFLCPIRTTAGGKACTPSRHRRTLLLPRALAGGLGCAQICYIIFVWLAVPFCACLSALSMQCREKQLIESALYAIRRAAVPRVSGDGLAWPSDPVCVPCAEARWLFARRRQEETK
jgi:hypothetical protein